MSQKITRALLSVSNKEGLIPFAEFLASRSIELVSTGGTAAALRDAGLTVTDVADITHFPEMMDGRLKTLHPMVHGGLLAKRDDVAHQEAMAQHAIPSIDLLVVNLYPFRETVASGADADAVIEKIDIGGPAMLRAAAKNHLHVTVVCDPDDYATLQKEIELRDGETSLKVRQRLAHKAFSHTAQYDAAISRWFASFNSGGESSSEINPCPEKFMLSGTQKQRLRYGENPHQQAALYVTDETVASVANAQQLQGKELSYNNIADTNAAFVLASAFESPTVALIKHANPCGVASADTVDEAFRRALACDPVSAYGGILATNVPFTKALAQAIHEKKLFLEVVIAPSIEHEALDMLQVKKNLRVLVTEEPYAASTDRMVVKSIAGGFLLQQEDARLVTKDQLQCVTEKVPSDSEMEALLFAFTVSKYVASNAIVLTKDRATIGIGAGQMSRVDSVRLAMWKAEEAGLSTEGAMLASDAFFPFADNIEHAAKAAVSAIIQPGGSMRDDEVIDAANAHGIAMVFTGVRHFRH